MSTGPASKILQLDLEHVVLQARTEGKGLDQITEACNDELLRRAMREGGAVSASTVSKSTVKRYLASLAPGTVAAAHEPTVAAENARVAIDFAERLGALDEKVRKWLDEADAAVTPARGILWDPYAQEPMPTKIAEDSRDDLFEKMQSDLDADLSEYFSSDVLKILRDHLAPHPVLIVDWHARKVAASELRGLLKNYAELMGRIHDAEQVVAFQESVLDAIREADPATAARVLAKMRERQSIRKASMLGA